MEQISRDMILNIISFCMMFILMFALYGDAVSSIDMLKTLVLVTVLMHLIFVIFKIAPDIVPVFSAETVSFFRSFFPPVEGK
jgi:hypothetical protein